jgi:nitrous oxidase accessory protein NosD
MNLTLIRSPFVAGVASLVLVAAAESSAQEVSSLSLNGGRTVRIERPGSYRLRHDVRLKGTGAAIVIAADGVTLDLGGHTLTGPGGKLGTGIMVEGRRNVSVKNGTLHGFGFGVQVVNSVNVKVQGLQITGDDAGGPPPGEVGILVLNSRGVEATRNVIARVFLGLFVRGGGSGANRLFENTLAGGDTGQIGICYNPDGLGTSTGPSGDLVSLNLVSGFKIGIQTSPETRGNLFRDNAIAFVQKAMEELSPAGATLFDGNSEISL